MTKKKSSDRSRARFGYPVPEFITAFLQADDESKREMLSSRKRPKEPTWAAVQARYKHKLMLQRLQTDYSLMLCELWEKLWLPAVEGCETLDSLPHPDIWREGALWRTHKIGKHEFMTGVILDVGIEIPEVLLALYAKEPEPIKGLTELGWVFVDKWDEFTTTPGLVLLPAYIKCRKKAFRMQLNVLNGVAVIRQQPQMYLGGAKEATGRHLAQVLAAQLIEVGALPVEIDRYEEWWTISAGREWLADHGFGKGLLDAFHTMVPFPAFGRYDFCAAILLTAFAEAVITATRDGITWISSNAEETRLPPTVHNLLSETRQGRTLAFLRNERWVNPAAV